MEDKIKLNKSRNKKCFYGKSVYSTRKLPNLCNHSYIYFTCGIPSKLKKAYLELVKCLESEILTDVSLKVTESPPFFDLEKEIENNIQNEKKKHTQIKLVTSLKGTGFVQVNIPNNNTNDNIYNIMSKMTMDNSAVNQKHMLCCKYLMTVIPMDVVCRPHLKNFIRSSSILIASYFPMSSIKLNANLLEEVIQTYAPKNRKNISENQPNHKNDKSESCNVLDTIPTSNESNLSRQTNDPLKCSYFVETNSTWAIKFKSRFNMNTIDQQDAIDIIATFVGTNYKVNLNNPDYTIFVCNTPVCCSISVLRNSNKFFDYNLHRLCNREVYSK